MQPFTLPKGHRDEPPAPGPPKTPTAYEEPGGRTASLSPSRGTFTLMLMPSPRQQGSLACL